MAPPDVPPLVAVAAPVVAVVAVASVVVAVVAVASVVVPTVSVGTAAGAVVAVGSPPHAVSITPRMLIIVINDNNRRLRCHISRSSFESFTSMGYNFASENCL
jgi:hypothetical protein